jgi:DNA repair protein RecO (recombination protein O)
MFSNERVIILKSIKYQDTDLILHAINKQGGKLNFIAKGALRSKKRFGGGVLEPLNYIEVNYKNSKNSENLSWLNEAKLISDFSGLRKDYSRLELALYFAKVIDKVTFLGELHSPDCFNLLGHSLKVAETTDKLDFLKTLFELKLLYFQGVLENSIEYKEWLMLPVSSFENLNLDESNIKKAQSHIHKLLTEWLGTQL